MPSGIFRSQSTTTITARPLRIRPTQSRAHPSTPSKSKRFLMTSRVCFLFVLHAVSLKAQRCREHKGEKKFGRTDGDGIILLTDRGHNNSSSIINITATRQYQQAATTRPGEKKTRGTDRD